VVLFNFPKKELFKDVPSAGLPHRHAVQLIYVGSIAPERGQWLMLDIIRILVKEYRIDVGLFLAGYFDSPTKQNEFLNVVDGDNTLRGRVDYVGVVPQNELPKFLASSDIGLVPLQPVPKFHKNIPTKLFEYMAAGLPVVASDLPPIRRFVEESRAGILAHPGNPRSFAETINFVKPGEGRARHLGACGRAVFLSRYNWSTEVKKLLDLYGRLLNPPPAIA
jgi:glycosyltransferase involved in cell wall biosynthesis